MLNTQKENTFSLKSIIHKALFLPNSLEPIDLLQNFKQTHSHMAIVVDEYGGTEGIVTIEDILEEIIGDFYNENQQQLIQKFSQKQYLVNPIVSISELNHILKINLPVLNKTEANTLSGFLQVIHEKIPQKDEIILYNQMEFKVLQTQAQTITKVLVNLKP